MKAWTSGILVAACTATAAFAADIIVSAQDGKFVRVEGRATFPEPAPPDSLVVIDASQFPPKVKGAVEGIEHTVQGPPQAVAVTPDGKLALVDVSQRPFRAVQDSRYLLLQMDVERAIAVYAVRDGKLVDTGERIKLAAGPVSLRSMPR